MNISKKHQKNRDKNRKRFRGRQMIVYKIDKLDRLAMLKVTNV